MDFQEPKVEFVQIGQQFTTESSICGGDVSYDCDEEVEAGFEVCNCTTEAARQKVIQI